jgi:hypothetical protein
VIPLVSDETAPSNPWLFPPSDGSRQKRGIKKNIARVSHFVPLLRFHS